MSTHPLAILIPKDPPKPKLKPKGGPHPMLGINLNRKPTGQSDPYCKLMTPIPPSLGNPKLSFEIYLH